MGVRKKFAGGTGSITAHGKHELVLWAENNEPLQRQLEAWGTNFARKMKNGKFNRSLAIKGIANIFVPRVQSNYKRHFGSDMHDYGIPSRMSAVDKRKVASALLPSIIEDAQYKLKEMRRKKKAGRLI